MSKKNFPEPPKTERDHLTEALFGPDEEVDAQRAGERLRALGIDPSELVAGFKERVKEELSKVHKETGQVSEPLRAVLRSINTHQRENDPEQMDPPTWVEHLLGGTLGAAHQSHPVLSFRGCDEGEVSRKDKSILDALKDELESEEE